MAMTTKPEPDFGASESYSTLNEDGATPLGAEEIAENSEYDAYRQILIMFR